MRFLAWLLSLFFAFSLGANSTPATRETDEELRNRVQEHLDVIADESAAIVDEVTESIQNDERVQQAEQFARDVEEVAQATWDDLNRAAEDAQKRVEEKFGKGTTTKVPGSGAEETAAPEAAAPGVDQEAGTEVQEPAKDAGTDKLAGQEVPETPADQNAAPEADPGVDQETGTEAQEPAKDAGADELEGQEVPETPAGETAAPLLPELTPGQDPFNG